MQKLPDYVIDKELTEEEIVAIRPGEILYFAPRNIQNAHLTGPAEILEIDQFFNGSPSFVILDDKGNKKSFLATRFFKMEPGGVDNEAFDEIFV